MQQVLPDELSHFSWIAADSSNTKPHSQVFSAAWDKQGEKKKKKSTNKHNLEKPAQKDDGSVGPCKSTALRLFLKIVHFLDMHQFLCFVAVWIQCCIFYFFFYFISFPTVSITNRRYSPCLSTCQQL